RVHLPGSSEGPFASQLASTLLERSYRFPNASQGGQILRGHNPEGHNFRQTTFAPHVFIKSIRQSQLFLDLKRPAPTECCLSGFVTHGFVTQLPRSSPACTAHELKPVSLENRLYSATDTVGRALRNSAFASSVSFAHPL